MRPQRVQGWREGGCYFLKKRFSTEHFFFKKTASVSRRGTNGKKSFALFHINSIINTNQIKFEIFMNCQIIPD